MQNRIVLGGSSPLTRGTLPPKENPLFSGRFIPAYAGNSQAVCTQGRLLSVHPRLRGELMTVPKRILKTGGSSPLTRGTPQTDLAPGRNARFIPAYAGNSWQTPFYGLSVAVHPRLRGELVASIWILPKFRRFIPAYAGNSHAKGW